MSTGLRLVRSIERTRKLKINAISIVKFLLFSVVATYVFFPDSVDSKFGPLVAIVVVFLVVLMVMDGVKAAKKIKDRDV